MAEKDRHNSFEETDLGIGQNADGTFNTFPASELPQRVAQRESDEAATTYAIEQSEGPEPGEVEEVDQDELERKLEEAPTDGDDAAE